MTFKSIKFNAKEKYTRLFSTKSENALSLRSGHVVLKEGENIGEHSTDDSEEILIILEGRGKLYIKSTLSGEQAGAGGVQDEILYFGKDTALYIPPDTIHDVKNVGRGLLRYVFVASPTSNKGDRKKRAVYFRKSLCGKEI